MFWEVVGLERGPLSLVSTTEELLERKSSGSGLESQDYDLEGIRRPDYATPLSPQKSALTSPTSGGPSVGTVLSRTQGTEFVVFILQVWGTHEDVQRNSLELESVEKLLPSYMCTEFQNRIWSRCL
jgi:hypothetical protein